MWSYQDLSGIERLSHQSKARCELYMCPLTVCVKSVPPSLGSPKTLIKIILYGSLDSSNTNDAF